jgi:hypothetical protein
VARSKDIAAKILAALSRVNYTLVYAEAGLLLSDVRQKGNYRGGQISARF